MMDRRNRCLTGAVLASMVVLSAFATERNAGAADAPRHVNVHEHRTHPVAGLGPLTVHVWQRGDEIQVAALDQRGTMVVLRSGTIPGDTSNRTAPMQGALSARTRIIGEDGAVVVEECASTECAQAIADRASALAAQATFIANAASTTQLTMVRMCPTADDDTATITTNAHWAQAGASAPCKWRMVPAATFAGWSATDRSARVRVGDTVFQMHRTVLGLVHGG